MAKRARKPKVEEVDTESEDLLEDVVENESEEADVDTVMEEMEKEIPPGMDSPEWHDYVMRQFTEDEVNEESQPYVYGLRRVVRVVLGDIVKSNGTLLQCPDGTRERPAVAQHHIAVMVKPEVSDVGMIEVTEVSDVTTDNTDYRFLVHASATASTKAESRALRKILNLKKIVAAEEVGGLVFDEPSPDGKMTPSLATILTRYCQLNGINLNEVLKMGQKKFQSLDEVPQDTGELMFEHIQDLVRQNKVPEKIKLKA